MKILTPDDVLLIEKLVSMEAKQINRSFLISDTLGKYMLSNALTSFRQNYVKKVYGDVIFSMCSEYRHFVIKLLLAIDKKYYEIALSEILLPEIHSITDEQMLEALKEIK